MAINSINNYVSAASTVATDSKVSSKKTESSKNDTSTGVIYEKGSSERAVLPKRHRTLLSLQR